MIPGERKPLSGRRILVTRPRGQADELSGRIRELGGEAIEFPVMDIRPLTDESVIRETDAALKKLPDYDWILFTSVNGVEYFFQRLRHIGLDARALCGAKLAAVGPKTAEALRKRGLTADTVAGNFSQEGLLEALKSRLVPGQKALFPTVALARDDLLRKLTELGVDVTKVQVYENVPSYGSGAEIAELLKNKAVHIVTFASSSAVTNFLLALREGGKCEPQELLRDTEIACIGPLTARTAEEAGLKVKYVAREATIDGLLSALTEEAANKSEEE